jgi:hypothetical protein
MNENKINTSSRNYSLNKLSSSILNGDNKIENKNDITCKNKINFSEHNNNNLSINFEQNLKYLFNFKGESDNKSYNIANLSNSFNIFDFNKNIIKDNNANNFSYNLINSDSFSNNFNRNFDNTTNTNSTNNIDRSQFKYKSSSLLNFKLFQNQELLPLIANNILTNKSSVETSKIINLEETMTNIIQYNNKNNEYDNFQSSKFLYNIKVESKEFNQRNFFVSFAIIFILFLF